MTPLPHEILSGTLAVDHPKIAAMMASIDARAGEGRPVTRERALLGELIERSSERRAARLLSKQKHVTAIELDLGGTRFLLAAHGGAVETRCATAVRGIVLKSTVVSLDAWIDSLVRELANEAQTSEQSRLALEQLLEG